MDEDDVEDLLNRWDSCDQATRTTLSIAYLQEMHSDEGQSGWLEFLDKYFN